MSAVSRPAVKQETRRHPPGLAAVTHSAWGHGVDRFPLNLGSAHAFRTKPKQGDRPPYPCSRKHGLRTEGLALRTKGIYSNLPVNLLLLI